MSDVPVIAWAYRSMEGRASCRATTSVSPALDREVSLMTDSANEPEIVRVLFPGDLQRCNRVPPWYLGANPHSSRDFGELGDLHFGTREKTATDIGALS